ncbi:agmatine deiminase [Dysgonomonas sp. PFB1-18]|uniref:agmatine deiminase family protein n=1 Tax=unclassified Dysgonomonas TaxID=2630389 RepID=UPI00247649CB|nr:MULTISPECIES: agmatine deiminase family protein [unclassified Dysgonomonas]MDH6310144.1 agmatine deiminase [Dysgonomonas sp. PF1-14]MDH6340190.1 agmatine deiminase [Dysgonomonas sp. PF1-16]MDH6381701.1 agmatine deiminase [Dysgonomonas sp. PFB1-18]MDH6399060.1 agmatine deiminase [Dysgonomonas sp. PF1-23]
MSMLTTDKDADTVYFSEWITDFRCYKAISKILDRHHVEHELLPFTKDYWARDYMPVQISESTFIQYRYSPDYLQMKKSYITEPTACCKHLNIDTIKTDIVIDGGNIIKCNDAIIMTNKVFDENPTYSKTELINQLESLFQIELIIIPWDKNEPYGHTDGMVRFIEDKKVLLNNYADFDKPLRKRLIKALNPHFEIIELHYDVAKKSTLNWAYINFLQVNNLILLPAIGIEEDEPAFQLFKDIYKTNIEQIDVADIVRLGGALNCISWNIKQSLK